MLRIGSGQRHHRAAAWLAQAMLLSESWNFGCPNVKNLDTEGGCTFNIFQECLSFFLLWILCFGQIQCPGMLTHATVGTSFWPGLFWSDWMRWNHLHLWNSKRQPPRSKAADMTRLQLKNASMPEVGDGGEANQSAWFEDRWRFSTGGWSLFVPCGSDWPPDRLKPTSLATDSHDTLIIVVVFTFHYWRSSKYDGRISNRAYDIPPFFGEYITSDCVPRSGISIFMGDLPVGVSSLPASIHRIPLPVEAMFVSSYLSFLCLKVAVGVGGF